MKKILAILLPLALIMLTAACTTTVEVQFVSDAPTAADAEIEAPAEEVFEGSADPAMMEPAQIDANLQQAAMDVDLQQAQMELQMQMQEQTPSATDPTTDPTTEPTTEAPTTEAVTEAPTTAAPATTQALNVNTGDNH